MKHRIYYEITRHLEREEKKSIYWNNKAKHIVRSSETWIEKKEEEKNIVLRRFVRKKT